MDSTYMGSNKNLYFEHYCCSLYGGVHPGHESNRSLEQLDDITTNKRCSLACSIFLCLLLGNNNNDDSWVWGCFTEHLKGSHHHHFSGDVQLHSAWVQHFRDWTLDWTIEGKKRPSQHEIGSI